MSVCIYCGCEKAESEFSLEHIWPNALGGDYLPEFWKTNHVCEKCNRDSGLFVDGAFLKTWLGQVERSYGCEKYFSLNHPSRNIIPLSFMGKFPNAPLEMAVDFWIGPCGSHIIHFREEEVKPPFDIYVGGDPKKSKKRKKAGRVYVSFTTTRLFWIQVTLSSICAHFPHAKRYATNLEVLDGDVGLETLDWSDPPFPDDLPIIETIIEASKRGESLTSQVVAKIDFEQRFLAKLALAIGFQIFGEDYIFSDYAIRLRQAMWEPDRKKREKLEIRGAGYGSDIFPESLKKLLHWPGGWVLIVKSVREILMLIILTPSGNAISIVVSYSSGKHLGKIKEYGDGAIWLVLPSLGFATGCLSLSEYIAHQSGQMEVEILRELEKEQISPDSLPSC